MGKHVDNYLENYIDGNLTEDEKKQVEEHLKTCSDCARLFTVMPKVNAALPEMIEISVSEDFHSKMWAEIEEQKNKKANSWIRVSRPSFAFAVTFGLLFVACYYFKLGPYAKKELAIVTQPSIEMPGSSIITPEHKIVKKGPRFPINPANYKVADYPLIIAMVPAINTDVIARGNNNEVGKLYTINPLAIDNLTGKLLENEKVTNIDNYKVEMVKLPGKNVAAESKV